MWQTDIFDRSYGRCSQETEELGSSVDALRAEPLGVDSKGGRFWFFGTAAQEDCWLYRERVPETVGFTETWGPSGLNEPPWAAVCTTLAELQALTDQLGAAEDKSEQLLAAVSCSVRPLPHIRAPVLSLIALFDACQSDVIRSRDQTEKRLRKLRGWYCRCFGTTSSQRWWRRKAPAAERLRKLLEPKLRLELDSYGSRWVAEKHVT